MFFQSEFTRVAEVADLREGGSRSTARWCPLGPVPHPGRRARPARRGHPHAGDRRCGYRTGCRRRARCGRPSGLDRAPSRSRRIRICGRPARPTPRRAPFGRWAADPVCSAPAPLPRRSASGAARNRSPEFPRRGHICRNDIGPSASPPLWSICPTVEPEQSKCQGTGSLVVVSETRRAPAR
jgi:hypothetical protein